MSEKVQRHPGEGGLIVGMENVPPQAPPTLCPGAIVGHVPSRRFLLCVCVCVCLSMETCESGLDNGIPEGRRIRYEASEQVRAECSCGSWGPGAGQSHFTEDTACPSGQGPVESFWHTALSFQAQSTGAPCWSQKAYPPAHLSPSCPGRALMFAVGSL